MRPAACELAMETSAKADKMWGWGPSLHIVGPRSAVLSTDQVPLQAFGDSSVSARGNGAEMGRREYTTHTA